MELSPSFRVYFNKNRQWLDIYLWDVHPTTFDNWKMGRWGMFDPKWFYPRSGHFGNVHMVESRVREDLVVHEMAHAWVEWLWCGRTSVIGRNEETMIAFLDELVRKFHREHKKYKERKDV